MRGIGWALILLMLATWAAAEAMKANYKVSRISTSTVGVSCNTGTVPQVEMFGSVALLTCK